ncbi:MAG: hypothetical protein K2P78_09065, partial [Gemmataceae bacterium]|nr:hypothetical protein [Gemmataceae bacterium]
MKSRLNVHRLEDRDCPAAGSSLTQIAVGSDFTLSINSYGRFASMQMSGPDWVDWMDTNQSLAQIQAMTKRIYQYFPDQFDNIFFVNNLPDLSPNAQYFGANYTATIKNDTQGIGRPLFNNTAAWGSAGKLQNVIHLASMQDLYYRTTLHEMIHRDAAFLSQLGGPSYGAHWGFSSVGGQLGGWVPGTLRQIGANTY